MRREHPFEKNASKAAKLSSIEMLAYNFLNEDYSRERSRPHTFSICCIGTRWHYYQHSSHKLVGWNHAQQFSLHQFAHLRTFLTSEMQQRVVFFRALLFGACFFVFSFLGSVHPFFPESTRTAVRSVIFASRGPGSYFSCPCFLFFFLF